MMPKPFVYIAAVRRSGSKLLSTLLTRPPDCLILREPGLVRDKFRLKEQEIELLERRGIVFKRQLDKSSAVRGAQAWEVFFDEVLPVLQAHFRQVGIKEIWHDRALELLEQLGENRIVVTARDPRDIYLSLHRNREKFAAMGRRKAHFPGGFNPQSVATHLGAQFAEQRKMLEQHNALGVRYEDLCREPQVQFARVSEHVESAIHTPSLVNKTGNLGGVFGESINTSRVFSWKSVDDRQLLDQAHETAALLPDYLQYWGYEASGR